MQLEINEGFFMQTRQVHTQNNYSYQQLATLVVDARNTYLSYLLQQSLGKSLSLSRPVEIFEVLGLDGERSRPGQKNKS
jgi:hypothetical protein